MIYYLKFIFEDTYLTLAALLFLFGIGMLVFDAFKERKIIKAVILLLAPILFLFGIYLLFEYFASVNEIFVLILGGGVFFWRIYAVKRNHRVSLVDIYVL